MPGQFTATSIDQGQFIRVTKTAMIPKVDVVAVRRARFGDGAVVVTNRCANRVIEKYEDVVAAVYGVVPGDKGEARGS